MSPPGRVDVEVDVLVGLLRLEEEQLRADQVGDRVVDRRAEEDDALLQQARVQVVGPLAPVGRLDDGGHQVVAGSHAVSGRAAHRSVSSFVASASASSSGPVLPGSLVDPEIVAGNHVPLVVDELHVVEQPCQRLGLPLLRAYRDRPPGAVELLPQRRGLHLHPGGHGGHLGVELVVLYHHPPDVGHGPEGQVGLHRPERLLPQLPQEILLGATGHGEQLGQGDPLLLEPVAEVVDPLVELLVHQDARDLLVVHQADELVERVLAQGHLRLHHLHLADPPAQVVAQLRQGGELRRLGRPLVGRRRAASSA